MPKPRSGGRKPKDASITNAFNALKVGDVLTKKDISAAKRAAKVEKLRLKEEKKARQEEIRKLSDKLAKVGKQVGLKVGQEIVNDEHEEQYEEGEGESIEERIEGGVVDSSSPDSSDPVAESNTKSAYQMLEHLRYAYRNSKSTTSGKKGRARIVELMNDDKEFKFIVKELLKIEASLLSAKIRKEGDNDGGKGGVGQQNFFVVLKGLEDEKKLLSDAGVVDKTVDMKQIQRAMNPEMGEVYEVEEVSKTQPPEQLGKGNTGGVDGW
jgi:hypothetical protein